MKRTVFISEKKPSDSSLFKWQCSYIFWDKVSKKWYEDTTYFDDDKITKEYWRKKGYVIK